MALLTEFPTTVWISNLETLKHRQSAEENPQDGSGNQAGSAERAQRVAVEDLVLSQEDKAKGTDQLLRFRTELPFSVQVMCTGYFTVISCSSNTLNDTVLSCCLEPIASLLSLADKQRYRLQ